jgi:heat shock 70kDa protein 4
MNPDLSFLHCMELGDICTSTPYILNCLIFVQVYDKVPSTTLNADEAVSRGCALQCAILSPTFKVNLF